MSAHPSSTVVIPQTSGVPRHIAIIMDGNGRWAKQRFLPRIAGHRRGIETVRATIKTCIKREIGYLTLFAFSSENWRRPEDEVVFLMELFVRALEQEVAKLHENGICFKVVGDMSAFDPSLVELIHDAEQLTARNTRLVLTIAANYGGRWDVMQAINRLRKAHPHAHEDLTELDLAPYLSMHYAPEPDLFVRTGGESRISNFLLWQLAYTELYFTDTLWPDFDAAALDCAISAYRHRERRFGRTGDQLRQNVSHSRVTPSTIPEKTSRRLPHKQNV
ncbi:MAG: polyprenyl diphosphate synthase [Burkholderiales bacterium]|nr:di-trans,poly-cis-decaprenylcistransferase [Burkholderiales bacterium]MDQ3197412.1 polyprenyl diphosphate synthase [Pseudomonadota bacterium]